MRAPDRDKTTILEVMTEGLRRRTAAQGAGIRLVEPRLRSITPAVDLGGVDVLKHGNMFLVADQAGDIEPDGRGLGLYDGDTRIVSMATLKVAGQRLTVLEADEGATWRSMIHLTNSASSPGPTRTLSITRERWIDDGFHELVAITNQGAQPVSCSVELGLEVDMADIFEVRGYPRPTRGRLLPIEIDDVAGSIDFAYLDLDGIERRTRIRLAPPTVISSGRTGPREAISSHEEPAPADITAHWHLELVPGETSTIAWTARLTDDRDRVAPQMVSVGDGPDLSHGPDGSGGPERSYRDWRTATTGIETDDPLVRAILARSIDDLRLLTNTTPEGEPYVAAGVPWFSALFGRDTLLTGFETIAFMPWIARDALRALARRQAVTEDATRDAEPGKILHELRTGEMARTGEVPFGPYYGTADATPLFLVLLGETHDWTGDDALVDELWPNVLAALDWIEQREKEGGGFITYRARSEGSFPNQGWKDSPDAIRDARGRLADPPIALAEVQGYAFDARRRMARLARNRGDFSLADNLDAAATALAARFGRSFRSRGGVVPMALDGQGTPMDAVASNMGHCLWSGIIAAGGGEGEGDDRAVARRLMEPDLFSGWGIRTYATGQPGYDPLGYHVGTVWPHDTAIVAAGLRRAGADDAASHLATALLEAAGGFPGHRLPEAFAGFERVEGRALEPYPVSCSPQAWSAAAPLSLLRTLLGLRADAAERSLVFIRPHLPFEGEIVLRGLRVGQGSCDVRIRRSGGTTSVEVIAADGLTVTVETLPT